MTLDDEIKHCEEVAKNQEWMAENYDDDSMGAKVCLVKDAVMFLLTNI